MLGQRGVAEVKLNVMAREGGRIVEVEEWQGERRDGRAAQVLAVYFEEKPTDVNILRGENRGVTLPHRNVMRDLVVLGEYRGGKEVFEVPNDRVGLRMCVLVQAGRGGKILGAVA